MRRTSLRRARIAVTAAFFVNGAIFASWATRVPAVKERLHLTAADLGIALFGLTAGALLGMALTGLLLAHWTSTRATRLALALYPPALVLLALAPNLPMLVAATAVMGIASSALDVAMNVHGVRVEREYGRPILAGFHGWFSLGNLVGAGLGVGAAAIGLTPLAHFVITAATTFVAGLLAGRWLLPGPDHTGESRSVAWPTPDLVLLGLLAFCCLLAEGAVNDWSAVYLREAVGASPALAAAAFTAFSLTMTGGRLLADRVVAPLGAVRYLQVAGAIATGALLVIVLAPHPSVAIAGFGLLGAGLAGVVPAIFRTAAQTRRVTPGSGIAAVSTLGYLGFVAGPPVIGGVAEVSSLRIGLGIVVILVAALAVTARRAVTAVDTGSQHENAVEPARCDR